MAITGGKHDKIPKPMTEGQWFARGEQFLIASNALSKCPEGSTHWVDLPLVGCRAFATECYLKCLLTMDQIKFPYTHNLRDLFYLLPVGRRQKLGKEWASWVKGRLPKTSQDAPVGWKSPRTLGIALQQSARAFEQFRYQSTDVGGWSLMIFPWMVRDTIIEERPHWDDYEPNSLRLLDPDADAKINWLDGARPTSDRG